MIPNRPLTLEALGRNHLACDKCTQGHLTFFLLHGHYTSHGEFCISFESFEAHKLCYYVDNRRRKSGSSTMCNYLLDKISQRGSISDITLAHGKCLNRQWCSDGLDGGLGM